jgi:hypothetical protein
MADGYLRVEGGESVEVADDAREAETASELLGTLRGMVRKRSVQTVLVPYSFPDLPVLEEALSQADLGEQLLEGETALNDVLGIEVDRGWVLPPGGRLDMSSLEALQEAGVRDGVFFSYESLRPLDPEAAGCPEPALSFACPIRVETGVGGAIDGYVHDPQLQERLTEMSARGSGRLEVQRVLAETAMIHAELPGIGGRVLHLNVPATWHPHPRTAEAFFGSLRRAPWLENRTPNGGLNAGAGPARREVVDEAPPFPNQPTGDYFASIVATEDLVGSFSNFISAREQRRMLRRLRRNVLVSEGQTLWSEANGIDRALSYAEDSRDEIDSEMGKVTLGVPGETTFTSRAGSLDISLFNQTGYPIDARVLLTALDMEFDPATFDRTFPPGTTRLSVGAEAQASGTFPIEVRAETEDGHPLAIESVQVRSTEFNIVALAITLGAVAFLILFYVTKAIRRRRRREPASASST